MAGPQDGDDEIDESGDESTADDEIGEMARLLDEGLARAAELL